MPPVGDRLGAFHERTGRNQRLRPHRPQYLSCKARHDKGVDFVAVNDITDAATLAHLLKYDSIHGASAARSSPATTASSSTEEVEVLAEKDPGALPWKDLGVEVVIESTGLFNSGEKAGKHLAAGARRSSSAPRDQARHHALHGRERDAYDPAKHHVISNASCTTNCLAPLVAVLHGTFGSARAS